MLKKMLHKQFSETEELSYRRPLQIAEVFVSDGGDAFPICPKCRVPFDVEYQRYCSYCGQCLKWTYYSRAKKVYSKHKQREQTSKGSYAS